MNIKLSSRFFTEAELTEIEAHVVSDTLMGFQQNRIAAQRGIDFPNVAFHIQSAREKTGVPTVVGNHAPRLLLRDALSGGLALQIDADDADRIVRLGAAEKDVLLRIAKGQRNPEICSRIPKFGSQFKLNKAFGNIQGDIQARHIVHAALKYAAARKALQPDGEIWPHTSAEITNE